MKMEHGAAAPRTPEERVERRRLILVVAGETGADTRTVAKVYDGRAVRGDIGARIAARLNELRAQAR